MSYIATPHDFRYPWYMKLLLWRQRRRYGRELEPVRLWGRIPRAFLAMSAMYRVLDRKSSPIEPALRSLIQVRVSQVNSCAFCIDLNSAIGRQRGVSDEKLVALVQSADSMLFTEREKAAIEFAQAVTHGAGQVDAALIARLHEHFNDQAIVELAALIAYQNMSSKFNAALGVPAQGFCATTNR